MQTKPTEREGKCHEIGASLPGAAKPAFIPLVTTFLIALQLVGQNPQPSQPPSKTVGKGAHEVKQETGNLLQEAQSAMQRGKPAEAIALATRAVNLEPNNARTHFIRAKLHELTDQPVQAIEGYSRVIELDTNAVDVFHYRGGEYFKTAQIDKSIRDFDRFLALRPDQAPYHWQRGISLYYAGRFGDGKKQFELHQTVNTSDVENAAWHFLCNAKANSPAQALKELLKIGPDSRPAMMDIFAVFQGRMKPEDLPAAVAKIPEGERRQAADFYAALYLGLYHEAIGEQEKANPHLLRAAALSKGFGYMGDVARVHVKIRFAPDSGRTAK